MAAEVLVVEDEPDIRNLMVLHLAREGFRCRTATSGPEALREARAATPDLVILDLMLPDLDGLEVCRRLRSDTATATIPIIMLTAKADEVDRAVLRRARPTATPRVLRAGAITVDPMRHRVEVAGAAVVLTPKEFDLLQALVEASGRVLSREHLLEGVWGYARAGEIESRTVDVHVRRLRAKLGGEGCRITTIKGVGYRFEGD